ncbi:MAG TPA: hypothetical protein VFX75_02745 [Nitrososphaeraceae archaeon]|nr:hypothetical protein [Nitrososphaeraceae archaeon]
MMVEIFVKTNPGKQEPVQDVKKKEKVENKKAFNRAIECLLHLVSHRDAINDKLHEQVLVTVSYRISADYGKLEVASSGEINSSHDLFGPTLNS